MPELEPIDELPEVIEDSAAHVTGLVSHSISTDGKTALVVFNVVEPNDPNPVERKFALTFPVGSTRLMANLMHDIHVAAQRASVPADQMVLHFPNKYDIGHTNQKSPDGIQGQTAVTLDKGMASEYTFIMPNIAAMIFAHQLQNGTKAQLTEQERNLWREQMLQLNNSQALAVPSRKIIMPPMLPPASS